MTAPFGQPLSRCERVPTLSRRAALRSVRRAKRHCEDALQERLRTSRLCIVLRLGLEHFQCRAKRLSQNRQRLYCCARWGSRSRSRQSRVFDGVVSQIWLCMARSGLAPCPAERRRWRAPSGVSRGFWSSSGQRRSTHELMGAHHKGAPVQLAHSRPRSPTRSRWRDGSIPWPSYASTLRDYSLEAANCRS